MDILRLFFSGEKGSRAPIFDWLPMGLLVVFALVLYWSDVSLTQPPTVRLVIDHATDLNATQLVLLILIVPIVAIFLQPMQDFLMRLQEGYWPSLLAPLARLMRRWYMRRVKQVKQSIDRQVGSSAFDPKPFTRILSEVQRDPSYRVEGLKWLIDRAGNDAEREAVMRALFEIQQYPDESRIMPTRLGNILRASEDNAGERYGLSTVDIWPRLYQVLPQRLIDSATSARNELDLALRFSGTFFLGGISSFVLMAQHGWWLLVPITWIVSAWLSYQTAIGAADKYGEAVRIAFDIYRFDLLRTMHIPLPATSRQEILLNQRLSESLRYPGVRV